MIAFELIIGLTYCFAAIFAAMLFVYLIGAIGLSDDIHEVRYLFIAFITCALVWGLIFTTKAVTCSKIVGHKPTICENYYEGTLN